MNFQSLLAQHVQDQPDKTAWCDQDGACSYGQLADEVQRFAALLHERGARRGQRLALWMPNCRAWLVVFLACARLGLTVVAVNTRFRAHEVGALIERGQCAWMVLWPDFKGLPFAQTLAAIPAAQMQSLQGVFGVGGLHTLQTLLPGHKLWPYEEQPQQPGVLAKVAEAHDSDGALVFTTSGTTSAPKLVLHRQAGLIAHGMAASLAYGVTPDSCILVAAPLCGAFGFSSAMLGLAQGASLVTLPVFQAQATLDQMAQWAVTHSFANNELIDLLLQQLPPAGPVPAAPLARLQYMGYASFAPALDDLPERARAAGIPLAGLYGSSELQALVAGQPLQAPWEQRRLAGGRLASPQGLVRAVDVHTGQSLAHGEIGAIEIFSPSIMSEYLDDPEATAKALTEDGYFRTGDLGYTVDKQSFVFQGRNGDYLRLGGFLVNPVEIESFIEQLDNVRACQVVGAAYQGKLVPVAFVIAQDECEVSQAQVIEYCAQSMAGFKVPKLVVCLPEFPVVQSANSNKIQRSQLQQMAAKLLSA